MSQQIQSTENNDPSRRGFAEADWLQDYEGQLAVDVYQTTDEVVLKAPIAGVNTEDLEISITEDLITIKGQRHESEEVARENFFAQECYWGAFSRSYVLPVSVDADRSEAKLKNGILTVRMPKLEKTKTKVIEIKTE